MVTSMWLVRLAALLAFGAAVLVGLSGAIGRFLPGDLLAFASYADADIYLLDLPTRLTMNLTRDLNANDFQPVWSPDGRQIAFMSIGGELGSVRVYLMNADGSGLRLLADYDNQTTAVELLWSPDSSRLALSSVAGIHILDVKSTSGCVFDIFSSDLCQYAHIGGSLGAIASDWSPQHNLILFSSSYNTQQIFAVKPDGSALRQLTNSEYSKTHPVWSPDGSQIAAISLEPTEWLLYLMDADGENLRPIAHNLSDISFAWSPDGSQIAYTAWGATGDEVFLLDIASGTSRQLTRDGMDDIFPVWSPDGSRLGIILWGDYNTGLYLLNGECIRLPEGCGGDLHLLTDNISSFWLSSFSWQP